MSSVREVSVELGERSYRVLVGSGIIDQLGTRTVSAIAGRSARRAQLVVDDKLPAALVESAKASLMGEGLEVGVSSLVARESEKSLRAVEGILVALTAARHERWDPVVALGGGITGDVAGFAASIYRRGVPFVQCPTTLLAMVDASVGGKTGVNVVEGGHLRKNVVGAFWQPRLVLADVESLWSLPAREFRAGLAECIKHAMIGGHVAGSTVREETRRALKTYHSAKSHVDWLDLGDGHLVDLIAAHVAFKAAIVAGDEREESLAGATGRAILNLGHTFGHAIEGLSGLELSTGERSPILHGEAVALGLLAAAKASLAAGVETIADWVNEVKSSLQLAGLPVGVRGLPTDAEVIAAMMHDKKVEGGSLRLILPTLGDRAVVVSERTRGAIEAGLAAIRMM